MARICDLHGEVRGVRFQAAYASCPVEEDETRLTSGPDAELVPAFAPELAVTLSALELN